MSGFTVFATVTAPREGAKNVSYDIPSQPGNITLVANQGIPGAAIRLPTAVFDVLLPRTFTGDRIIRKDLRNLAELHLWQVLKKA